MVGARSGVDWAGGRSEVDGDRRRGRRDGLTEVEMDSDGESTRRGW